MKRFKEVHRFYHKGVMLKSDTQPRRLTKELSHLGKNIVMYDFYGSEERFKFFIEGKEYKPKEIILLVDSLLTDIVGFIIDQEHYDSNSVVIVKTKPERRNVMSKQTRGQYLVGLDFNPSNISTVNKVKSLYAMIIDELESQKSRTSCGEVQRSIAIAITETQTAQMWAVKAITQSPKNEEPKED